jgi:hypothetical protein
MNTIEPIGRAIRTVRWLPFAVCLAGLGVAQAAVIEGRTADGHRYVAGGIGIEEVDQLRAQAAAYSLQLITAARGGEYLAGTHVRILGAGNEAVLDTRIDAPWLLVDLPAGRYTVIATYSGTTQERRLTVAPGQSQRIVLHFDAVSTHEGSVETSRSGMPQ